MALHSVGLRLPGSLSTAMKARHFSTFLAEMSATFCRASFGGFLIALVLCAVASPAVAQNRVTLARSMASIRAKVAATARALDAADLKGGLDFSVALQMRNFAELEARVARGETMGREELERLYLPLPADYAAVKTWLVAQGFTVTQDDASRLSVFARGTVAQVQSAFQVNMVKVTSEGVDYAAADSQPSLPAAIAAPVLGINGLHPYHHLHKHSRPNPHAVPSAGYKINNILTTYDATSLGVTGAGQTIAILIDATPLSTDLTKFWTNNSSTQTTGNVTTINVNNTTITTREGEETLDVEWAGGIAPGAKIRVYACGAGLTDTQLDAGLARIISDSRTDATIHQLSISLGEGETYETNTAQFTTDHNYFTTLASQGVSTFVSSGDGGSTPDDTGSGNEDAGPLQVEYYSSDSSVTAVGGTSINVVSTTNFARSTETAWSGSGGGVSIQFDKPAWQVGTGVPAGTKRYVPDVAMPADPNTGAYVYYGGSPTVYGGTSWAAPTWAGFCALINEARANAGKTGGIGLLNPSVYPLIGTNSFYDITSGNNAEGSKAGGKYATTTGYDPVTGVGVPDVKNLIAALLGGGTTTAAPTITGFTPTSGAVGTSVTITGTNLTGATAVSFNGTAATSYTVSSATQIVATVPTAAITGTISVTTSGGTGASSGAFTVTTSGGTGGTLVISQIYGGSSNAASTYKNDYVELFNPGTTAVNLSTYSIQYASATGATYTGKTNLTGTIQPQHYYLVQEATGSGITSLPTPDATGTIDLSGTAGRVALVSNQTLITSKTSAGVVDFVGYGTTASEYLGSGPAPAPSTTTADLRGNGGSTNTGNNKADFTAGAPNPRNSSTSKVGGAPDLTITIAHAGSFTQADQGDAYTITVTNDGTAATSGTVSVADALPGGLTATEIGGTGWTASGTAMATRTDALAAGGSYPVLTVMVNVSSTAVASVTNTATVSGGGETNTANNGASDPTSITALTPSQNWRYTYFGTTGDTGSAADTANPSGDGLPNLLKYALGLNPLAPTANPMAVDVSTGHLRLTVPRSSSATDVTLAVQVNGTLSDPAGWTAGGTTVDQNTATLLQVHDDTLVSGGQPRFLRLVVTRP